MEIVFENVYNMFEQKGLSHVDLEIGQIILYFRGTKNMIREKSPWTARIYDDLSRHYEEMSIQERKSAEDGL